MIVIDGIEQPTRVIEGGAEDLIRDPAGNPLPGLFGCAPSGSACFLVGRGPSATPARWQQLADYGCVTCAVNEYPEGFHPDFWVTIDPPPYFPRRCWVDPIPHKFARLDWRHVPLAEKPWQAEGPDGTVVDVFGINPPSPGSMLLGAWTGTDPYPHTPAECPRTYFFEGVTEPQHPSLASLAWVCPWLWDGLPEDSITRRGVRNVLFSAVRILYHLGFAKVYLLGFDGLAGDDGEQPGSPEGFRGQFASVNRASRHLRGAGVLSNNNFEVRQTSPAGMERGLDAVEYVDFDRAVALAATGRERRIIAPAAGVQL